MKSKPTIYWHNGLLFKRALAVLVALSTMASASSLIGNDHEDKYKTRDTQGYVQTRDRDVDQDAQDVNAKTDPEKFIRHVARSEVKEIRLANLAKLRAQNQEVKEFAERLIQDHTKANNELKLIAQHMNIPWVWDITGDKTPAAVNGTARGASSLDASASTTTPSESEVPRIDEKTPAGVNGTARGAYKESVVAGKTEQVDPYDHLVGLSGSAFDTAFVNHEMECHTRAVAKFEKANRDLPDSELKRFVESTLPTLRTHLAMAKRLADTEALRLNIRERSDRNADYKTAEVK